jgi:ABC-2 type transport system ATP-binding protein
MVVQVHLALIAAIDAKLMILDEPTLGLDVISRKGFYEMLIDEWCDGERSVLISTHQVEEIEALLTDVLMLDEGKLVLNLSLEAMERPLHRAQRMTPRPPTEVARSPSAAALSRTMGAQPAALFDGAPPQHLAANWAQRFRPSLVDLFVALTRKPELAPRSQA